MTARAIRVLQEKEVETLVGWAADEGWNPGLDDAAPFRAADPEGFLGAFVGDELAAAISAVRYGDRYGFIGLYICRPDMRGQGHGKAVWDAGMRRLSSRVVGLDGVPAQLANYARMGFRATYRTVRYSGVPCAPSSGQELERPGPALLPSLLDYDRRWFPAPREQFLRLWLSPPRRALVAMRDGSVVGYGVARECRDGWKIGPLFADDEPLARTLFAGLAREAGGVVHVDAPESNAAFVAYLADCGLRPGFETIRMFAGGNLESALAGFATTSLELG